MSRPRLSVLVALVLAAVATRLVPHPPNMTCLAALALFGGAYFTDRRLAYAVPLAALCVSDLALGFYPHMEVQYLAFALVVALGTWTLRQRRGSLRVAGTSLVACILFFVVTNLGVWAFSGMYPRTLGGLAACYLAAVPFFGNALLGDALFTVVLFGGFHLLENRFAALQEPQPAFRAVRPA